MQKEMQKIKYLFIYMFSDNIIPDDMLDGFYDKTKTDASNNIVDASNNIVDTSNNIVENKPRENNNIYGGGGFDNDDIMYIIRPIDRDGDMIGPGLNKKR
jgi:hypothetical protein